MSPHSLLINPYTLKIADLLSRQQVMYWFDFYSKAQWWSREKLLFYQSEKLRNLLQVAVKEVPLYRDLYAKHGIDVSLIKTVDDMHKLPVISKKDLKACYPDGCTRRTNWPVKEYFTSGSSGNPFAVMVDNQTMSQARALMLLRANYSGWQQGDAVFQTGMSLKRGVVKKIKDLVFNTYYASAFDLSDARLDYYLDKIKQKNIKYLMGYPASMFALANRANQVGLNIKISGVVTWGDNLYEHFRKCIEQQFQCRVTDTYGCGEGIQVAAQCPDGNGKYHVFMPHVIVEVVDDAGMPVPRGQLGNIILTCLEPGAMPLIRYNVGDVGRMCVEETCSCGRGYDILEKIEGRDSDIIRTPGGNKLIVHFFTGIFEYYPQIAKFRVHQSTIDELNIQIVFQPNTDQNILENIRNEILEKGDKDLKINFDILDDIAEGKNGKRRFVISDVKY